MYLLCKNVKICRVDVNRRIALKLMQSKEEKKNAKVCVVWQFQCGEKPTWFNNSSIRRAPQAFESAPAIEVRNGSKCVYLSYLQHQTKAKSERTQCAKPTVNRRSHQMQTQKNLKQKPSTVRNRIKSQVAICNHWNFIFPTQTHIKC